MSIAVIVTPDAYRMINRANKKSIASENACGNVILITQTVSNAMATREKN